jgi:NTE family protein
MHVARLNAPNLKGEDHTKDIDFTAAGIRARWQAGHDDTKRMLAQAPWMNPVDPTQGIVIHEPVETTVHIAEGVDGFAGRTR